MNDDDRLHRALRALPDRRAPAALLSKVLAEVKAREEKPVWRHDAGVAAAAALALAALRLEAGAAASAAAPWAVMMRALSGPLLQLAQTAASFAWEWRVAVAGLAMLCLTACSAGTVAVVVMLTPSRRTL